MDLRKRYKKFRMGVNADIGFGIYFPKSMDWDIVITRNIMASRVWKRLAHILITRNWVKDLGKYQMFYFSWKEKLLWKYWVALIP